MPGTAGPYELDAVRLILGPDGTATTKRVGPDFYAELDTEFHDFHGHMLISRFAFDEDWPTWEMHPEGDEFVYLLEGDASFILRCEGVEQTVRISHPGEFVVVPKGAWHTARPHVPTVTLFVTPGEGTQNLETPPGEGHER